MRSQILVLMAAFAVAAPAHASRMVEVDMLPDGTSQGTYVNFHAPCRTVPVHVRLSRAEHKQVPGTTRDRSAVAYFCKESDSMVHTEGYDLYLVRAKEDLSVEMRCLSSLCKGDPVSFYHEGIRHLGTALALYENGKIKIEFRDAGRSFHIWRDFADVSESHDENACRGRSGHSQMCP